CGYSRGLKHGGGLGVLRHCPFRLLLVEHLDVAQMARGVARPPYAVRVGWISFDPSRIRLHDRQRELGPCFRLGIEAGDFIRRLLGQPNHLVLWIGNHVIRAIVLGRRLVKGHFSGFMINLHELPCLMEAAPEIAPPTPSHSARTVGPGRGDLVFLSLFRIPPPFFFGSPLENPTPSPPRHIYSVSAWVLLGLHP